MINIEEFDPDPFMEALNNWGLPWVVVENPETVEGFDIYESASMKR